jgi:hypothetical protein
MHHRSGVRKKEGRKERGRKERNKGGRNQARKNNSSANGTVTTTTRLLLEVILVLPQLRLALDARAGFALS